MRKKLMAGVFLAIGFMLVLSVAVFAENHPTLERSQFTTLERYQLESLTDEELLVLYAPFQAFVAEINMFFNTNVLTADINDRWAIVNILSGEKSIEDLEKSVLAMAYLCLSNSASLMFFETLQELEPFEQAHLFESIERYDMCIYEVGLLLMNGQAVDSLFEETEGLDASLVEPRNPAVVNFPYTRHTRTIFTDIARAYVSFSIGAGQVEFTGIAGPTSYWRFRTVNLFAGVGVGSGLDRHNFNRTLTFDSARRVASVSSGSGSFVRHWWNGTRVDGPFIHHFHASLLA